MKRTSLNSLIALTGTGFTGLAIIIDYMSARIDLVSQFSGSSILFPAVIACVMTPISVWGFHLVSPKFSVLKELETFSESIFRSMNPSRLQIIMLSLAAGIGEELLFRGVLQPLIGIGISSLLFAGAHTGCRFQPKILQVYFVAVFLLSIVIGFIARTFGLPTAIVFHTLWDYFNLHLIMKNTDKSGHNPDLSGSNPDEQYTQGNQ